MGFDIGSKIRQLLPCAGLPGHLSHNAPSLTGYKACLNWRGHVACCKFARVSRTPASTRRSKVCVCVCSHRSMHNGAETVGEATPHRKQQVCGMIRNSAAARHTPQHNASDALFHPRNADTSTERADTELTELIVLQCTTGDTACTGWVVLQAVVSLTARLSVVVCHPSGQQAGCVCSGSCSRWLSGLGALRTLLPDSVFPQTGPARSVLYALLCAHALYGFKIRHDRT